MKATLNGEPVELPDGLSVLGLLAHLQIAPARGAVERNGVVVKRAQHGEERLREGDELEVVSFVGGG